MALSESQRRQLEGYFNQLSKAEMNAHLESMSNLQRWLYTEHYGFYVQVKDKLQDVWDVAKKVAEGVLTVAGVAAAITIGLPIYALGKLFGVIDD